MAGWLDVPWYFTPSHTPCCSCAPPHSTSMGSTGDPSYPGRDRGVKTYMNDSASRVLVLLNHCMVMSICPAVEDWLSSTHMSDGAPYVDTVLSGMTM